MSDPQQPKSKDSDPAKPAPNTAQTDEAGRLQAGKNGAGAQADTKDAPTQPAESRTSGRIGRWLVALLVLILIGVATGGFLLYRYAPDRLDQTLRQIGLPQIAALIADHAPPTTELSRETAGTAEADMSQPALPSDTAPSDAAPSDAAPSDTGPSNAGNAEDADSGIQPPSSSQKPGPEEPAPPAPATDVTPELERVTKTLDRLNARMSAIESSLEQTLIAADQMTSAPDASLPADLEKTLLTLTDSMTEVSTGLIALSSRVDRLETRETAAPLARSRQLSYALGLRELDRALQGSAPFSAELSALEELTGDDPAFAILRAHAADGIPSEATLRLQFPAAARAILNADKAGTDASWLNRLWASLRSLFMLRPTGDVLGDDTAAIVARAEARLAAGDLYAAVQQLAALQGPAAAAAQDWLAPANARLAAQQAMAGLTAQLTRAIAE